VAKIKEPSKIFVGSTFELFHESVVNSDYQPMDWILNTIKKYPQHTFILLTKCLQNLPKEFPENCWVGVSATNEFDFMRHFNALANVKATVKFWSFEPLLRWQGCQGFSELLQQSSQWVIIGQQTPSKLTTQPKIEWIKDIVESADNANAKVFLKDNLNSIFAANECEYFTKYRDTFFSFKDFLGDGKTSWHLRQEYPRGLL